MAADAAVAAVRYHLVGRRVRGSGAGGDHLTGGDGRTGRPIRERGHGLGGQAQRRQAATDRFDRPEALRLGVERLRHLPVCRGVVLRVGALAEQHLHRPLFPDPVANFARVHPYG